MQATPWNPERTEKQRQQLVDAGYTDGVHPYQIIKTDMDMILSKVCNELMNLANKRHNLPYWKPDLLIQLKDREPLRQAMEDYVQEYLNEAVPWYSSPEGLERAEEHEQRVSKQLDSMYEMENSKAKSRKEALPSLIAKLSPEDKAILLKSMIK